MYFPRKDTFSGMLYYTANKHTSRNIVSIFFLILVSLNTLKIITREATLIWKMPFCCGLSKHCAEFGFTMRNSACNLIPSFVKWVLPYWRYYRSRTIMNDQMYSLTMVRRVFVLRKIFSVSLALTDKQ